MDAGADMIYYVIMFKKQRTVCLNDINQAKWNGGHYKIYGYTNQDLAILFNCTVDYVRHLISNKQIDPMNLYSICSFWARSIGRRD